MNVHGMRRMGLGAALLVLGGLGVSPASAEDAAVESPVLGGAVEVIDGVVEEIPQEWWDVLVCEPVGTLPVEPELLDVDAVSELGEALEDFEFGEVEAGMVPVIETDSEVCFMPVLGAPGEELPMESGPLDESPEEFLPVEPDSGVEPDPTVEGEAQAGVVDGEATEEEPEGAVDDETPEVVEFVEPTVEGDTEGSEPVEVPQILESVPVVGVPVATPSAGEPLVMGQTLEIAAEPLVVQRSLKTVDFAAAPVTAPAVVADLAAAGTTSTGLSPAGLPATGAPDLRRAWLGLPLIAAGACVLAGRRRLA